jgi:hypothetical protein
MGMWLTPCWREEKARHESVWVLAKHPEERPSPKGLFGEGFLDWPDHCVGEELPVP